MHSLVFIAAAALAFDPAANAERIRSHLELVERLLRSQPAPSPGTEAERARNLAALHAYWRRGEYPQNTRVPGGRNPIFIDDRDVPCAAGALIIESGSKPLALRISRTLNEKYLDEIHDDELDAWVARSGLTLGELRLIQPGYPYRPKFTEPLLEAAYLGDLATVKALIKASKPDQATLNEALRAACEAGRRGHAGPRAGEISIGTKVPWVSDGLSTTEYLLNAGGDPNDTSIGPNSKGKRRLSVLASTQLLRESDDRVFALLSQHGATLNPTEKVLIALSKNDCRSLPALLKDPAIDFQAQDHPHPMHIRNRNGKGFEPACGVALIESGKAQWADPGWFEQLGGTPQYTVALLKQGVTPKTRADLSGALESWRQLHTAPTAAAEAALVLTAIKKSGVRLPETPPGSPPDQSCPNPVKAAIARGDVELIDLFVELGGEPRRCQSSPMTSKLLQQTAPLTPAALATLKRGLGSDFTLFDEWSSLLLLGWAAQVGDLELAKVLLTQKAVPDASAGYFCSPLALAATRDDVPMVTLLLANGAKPNARFVADRRCGWPNAGTKHHVVTTLQEVQLSAAMRARLKLGPPSVPPESHSLD